MTESYYELAQDTGYEELNFPPQPELQTPIYEFGPSTQPYQSNNGLTYVYDPTKASWTLRKGDTATQTYVDNAVNERLSKLGGTIMSDAGLAFKEGITAIDPVNLKIFSSGKIELMGASGGECNINFTGVNGTELSAGSISIENNVALKFNDGITTSENTLSFSSLLISRGGALIQHNDSSSAEVLLLNLGRGAGSTKNKIVIPGAGNLNIGTKNDTLITISSDSVEISGKLNACGVLLVDESAQTIKVPEAVANRQNSGAPNPTELATVNYVNSGRFSPGMSVFSEDEISTEVGGMWTTNKRFFIKVSE